MQHGSSFDTVYVNHISKTAALSTIQTFILCLITFVTLSQMVCKVFSKTNIYYGNQYHHFTAHARRKTSLQASNFSKTLIIKDILIEEFCGIASNEIPFFKIKFNDR